MAYRFRTPLILLALALLVIPAMADVEPTGNGSWVDLANGDLLSTVAYNTDAGITYHAGNGGVYNLSANGASAKYRNQTLGAGQLYYTGNSMGSSGNYPTLILFSTSPAAGNPRTTGSHYLFEPQDAFDVINFAKIVAGSRTSLQETACTIDAGGAWYTHSIRYNSGGLMNWTVKDGGLGTKCSNRKADTTYTTGYWGFGDFNAGAVDQFNNLSYETVPVPVPTNLTPLTGLHPGDTIQLGDNAVGFWPHNQMPEHTDSTIWTYDFDDWYLFNGTHHLHYRGYGQGWNWSLLVNSLSGEYDLSHRVNNTYTGAWCAVNKTVRVNEAAAAGAPPTADGVANRSFAHKNEVINLTDSSDCYQCTGRWWNITKVDGSSPHAYAHQNTTLDITKWWPEYGVYNVNKSVQNASGFDDDIFQVTIINSTPMSITFTCAPLTDYITFASTCTPTTEGNISKYNWSAPSLSQVSFAVNAVFNVNAAGTHDVNGTVLNLADLENASLVKADYLTGVVPLPGAGFNVTNQTATSPCINYFVSTWEEALDATGWTWDWNSDGTVDSTAPNRTHVMDVGVVVAEHTVTNASGTDTHTAILTCLSNETKELYPFDYINISSTVGETWIHWIWDTGYNTSVWVDGQYYANSSLDYLLLEGLNPNEEHTITLINITNMTTVHNRHTSRTYLPSQFLWLCAGGIAVFIFAGVIFRGGLAGILFPSVGLLISAPLAVVTVPYTIMFGYSIIAMGAVSLLIVIWNLYLYSQERFV